jgi:hypothetical protein
MAKNIRTIDESESGRNIRFENIKTGEEMTRSQFVNRIKNGEFPDYYVRKMNGLDTPISKPDGTENNNLD